MEVQWRMMLPHPSWDAEPDPVVWVDPVRFDLLWKDTDQWVSPGGKDGAQDDRYARFGAWLNPDSVVYMCEVWLEDGELGFINGRHRFAWLRDHHISALPMQVSPDNVKSFTALCGSTLRTSTLP